MMSAVVSTPSVTLAVLTYNGCELLDATLPSVLAQRSDGDLVVLVIDNGSTDGTALHVRERWPQVELLELPDNVGVAAALNRGVRASRTELVALLNNDVELDAGWLAPLEVALGAHPEAASASGKLLRYHDRERIDAAGDVLLRSAAGINRGAGELDRGQYDRPEAVFGACAGAALYRRCAFDVVGAFDETFFAYLEDVDWSMRAQLAGFSARYEPTAIGFHMGGATTRRNRGRYLRLQRRNQVLLIAKTFPASTLVRHGWRMAIHLSLVLVASARDGDLDQLLAGWAAALRMMPGALRRRRAVRATRRVRPRDVEALMIAGPPAGTGMRRRLLFEIAPDRAQRQIASAPDSQGA
jgi:GT2 family glycosyltransferase